MEPTENNELLRRAEDLAEQCERHGTVTHSGFLTPAEVYLLQSHPFYRPSGVQIVFNGGRHDCERAVMFCLPEYLNPEDLNPDEYIKALHIKAHFGTPGHRDYMGAVLGMGVERDRIGDIQVKENEAFVFCLPGVFSHLMSLDKVGRCGVTTEEVSASQVPAPERQVIPVTFSVMSPRLDAVVGGMFHLSRSEAARAITAGKVSVNYSVLLKVDYNVKEGDILSLQGHGKGVIRGSGGTSRKGRMFINTEVLK